MRSAGLDAFRRTIAEIEPHFVEHVKTLTDWQQFSLLSVESNRCPLWFKSGLLLIGDAAHVMSPIGGVGINYAVQDAVVTTNLLASRLRTGRVEVVDLARVQNEREWPVKAIQSAQSAIQNRVLASALGSPTTPKVPWYVRAFFAIPILRDLPARVFAYGIRRVRLVDTGLNPKTASLN